LALFIVSGANGYNPSMANPQDSWRDRRWKIFENVLTSNRSFQKQLTKLYEGFPENSSDFDDFLIKNGIPLECKRAIIMRLNFPDLNRDEYLEHITPPIAYWNAEAGYMGPYYPSPANYFRQLCENIAEELGTNDLLGVDYTKLDFEALTQLFAQDGTVINLTSYMDITDARTLLSTYKDELEALLKYRSVHKDRLNSPKLTGRVFKPRENKERDELVMRLTNDGKKASAIRNVLIKLGYGELDEVYIRRRERKRNSDKT
jgi:hypothetical protein